VNLKTALAVASAVMALAGGGGASASSLTPIASFADPAGGSTGVLGINNSGAMTGSIGYADGSGVGFVRSASGVYTTFSDGGAFFTQGRAIGNNGTIRGFSWDSTQNLTTANEFQRSSGGVVTTITNPATGLPLHGIAQGMNDSGAAVGDYYTLVSGHLRRHGYILGGGTLTDLHPPGAPLLTMEARAITDTGTVVGFGNNGGVIEGFILAGGVYNWFADPSAVGGSTHFEDINSHGLISGEYVDASGFAHAFVFNSSTDFFTNIDVPGAANSQAFGLNDWGQVVITSDLATGPNNFIYNAVPEPATWAMMLLGVFSLGGALRRRRVLAA